MRLGRGNGGKNAPDDARNILLQPKRFNQVIPAHQPPFPAPAGVVEIKRVAGPVDCAGGFSDRGGDMRIVKRKRLAIPFRLAATNWFFRVEDHGQSMRLRAQQTGEATPGRLAELAWRTPMLANGTFRGQAPLQLIAGRQILPQALGAIVQQKIV